MPPRPPLFANTLRDPRVMVSQGRHIGTWLTSVT
jgi:hypothetical protein